MQRASLLERARQYVLCVEFISGIFVGNGGSDVVRQERPSS